MGVLTLPRLPAGTHLKGDLQVDGFSHAADVGLTEVAGDADLGGLCIRTRVQA